MYEENTRRSELGLQICCRGIEQMANAKKNQMGISFSFLEGGKSLRNISNGAQYVTLRKKKQKNFPHIQVFSYLLLVLFQPHTLG